MTTIEYYRLVDDAEECRYIGAFDHEDNEGGRRQTADACARAGISEEATKKLIQFLSHDYVPINRNLPICCEEHEQFLDSLIEAARTGTPAKPMPQHKLVGPEAELARRLAQDC